MRLREPIDATKYDIRILWTGLQEEHVSPDAGVVEGYPLDPPDATPGWKLVDYGVESMKDRDRYFCLWIKEKVKVPVKKAKAGTKAKPAAKPEEKKPEPAAKAKPSTKSKSKTPPVEEPSIEVTEPSAN